MSVGHILAKQLLDPDPAGSHHRCHIQKQAVTGDAVQLQSGLKGLIVLICPAHRHPASSLNGLKPVGRVGAVHPVDGDAKALGNKANNVVPGNRGAALGKFDHTGVDVLHDDAVDAVAVLIRALRIGAQGIGLLQLIVGLHLHCPVDVIPDASHRLSGGQTAVTDGGVHILPVIEGQLLQKLRAYLGINGDRQGQAHPAHFRFKGGASVEHVLLPLLLFEPLLDLGPRLVGFTDIQPVTAGSLGRLGSNDLHDVAVFQRRIDVADPVVDLRPYQSVTHTGVDGIGKIDGGRACGQRYDLALRREHEDLIVEHIDLEGVYIIFRIGVLLAFQKPADPLKVLLVARTGILLILPVRRDTILCRLVHLPGADLHLKGNTLGADHRGVQALVHIGLGGRNVVLESAGHQIEQVVDMSQHVVAIGDGIHDDPEGIDVIQLIHGLVLGVHLPVNGVNVLDPTVGGVMDAHIRQPGGDLLLNGTHKRLILLPVGLQIGHNVLVARRVQIAQSNILQLPFDLLHTEPVSKRRIHIHSLPALADLLGRRLILHGTHIVQTVGDLDQHHPDVLGHSHKHLAQVLHLLLLGAGEIGTGQLGNALYQFCGGIAESLGNIIVGGIGVLDAVVEQSAQNGVHIQTHLRHDLRHRQRVNDVRRAVFPFLILMLFPGILHRPVDQRHIRPGHTFAHGGTHRRIVFRKAFHYLNSLSQRAAAAWCCSPSDPPSALLAAGEGLCIYAAVSLPAAPHP